MTPNEPYRSPRRRPLERRRFRLALLCAAGLVVVPFALQAHALRLGRLPWFMDTVAQFYPQRVHAAHLLAAGELPFWNRTVYTGVPFLANPQWGLLYPPHWVFFALPGPRTWTALNALHISLLGLGFFAWIRRVTRQRLSGALAAGVIAELSGWTCAHLAFGSYLQVAAWTPWLLWAFERGVATDPTRRADPVQNGRRLWTSAWFAALFTAFQWLAGAPQLALYAQVGLVVYAATRLAVAPARNRALFARGGFVLIVALAGGAGIAAPQLATTREFLADCERAGGLPIQTLRAGAVNTEGWARAWMGGTGAPEDAERILYPGLVPTAIATAMILFLLVQGFGAIGRRILKQFHPNTPLEPRRRLPIAPEARAAAWAGLTLLIVFSLGCWRPLVGPLHRWLPLYAHFHDPVRMLFLALVGAIALFAVGLQVALDRTSGRPRAARGILHAMAQLLLLVALFDLLHFNHTRVDTKTAPPPVFALDDVLARTGIQPGERFFAMDRGIQYSYDYTRPRFADSLLPSLGSLYGLEDIQGYDPCIPWRYALYMRRLNAGRVTLYPSHFGLVRNVNSPWLRRFGELKARASLDRTWPLFEPRWLRSAADTDRELLRIRLTEPFAVTKQSLAEMELVISVALGDGHVALVGRIGPLPVLRVHFLRGEEVLGSVRAEYPQVHPAKVSGPGVRDDVPEYSASQPLRKAVLSDVRVETRGVADAIRIRRADANPGAAYVHSVGLPRELTAFRPTPNPDTFASDWEESWPDVVRFVPAADNSLHGRRAFERTALAHSSALVQIELPPKMEPPRNIPNRVLKDWLLTEKRPNRLEVELAEEHGGGWLVMAEPWARGWRCRVDGADAPIYPADVLFRAAPVPPGARRVVMTCTPPGLREGCGILALTLLVAALTALRLLRFRPRASVAQR